MRAQSFLKFIDQRLLLVFAKRLYADSVRVTQAEGHQGLGLALRRKYPRGVSTGYPLGQPFFRILHAFMAGLQ